jgi:hypothetical protein
MNGLIFVNEPKVGNKLSWVWRCHGSKRSPDDRRYLSQNRRSDRQGAKWDNRRGFLAEFVFVLLGSSDSQPWTLCHYLVFVTAQRKSRIGRINDSAVDLNQLSLQFSISDRHCHCVDEKIYCAEFRLRLQRDNSKSSRCRNRPICSALGISNAT